MHPAMPIAMAPARITLLTRRTVLFKTIVNDL